MDAAPCKRPRLLCVSDGNEPAAEDTSSKSSEEDADLHKRFATGVVYSTPLRYVVLSQTGLTLREGCSIKSPALAERLPCNTAVLVDERRLEPTGAMGSGLMRARTCSPLEGWTTELPKFLALDAKQVPPDMNGAAPYEELARRETGAFNERGEDLRLVLDQNCADCVVLQQGFDVERLCQELASVERQHSFLEKTAVLHATKEHAGTRGWGSIPLRSIGGAVGDEGNTGTGVRGGGDYADTPLMEEYCPYIQKIVREIGGVRRLCRVRLMQLQKGGVISPHRDYLESHVLVRLHLPIITDSKVEFRIRGKEYQLEAGKLYFTNVRQVHEGMNRSDIDRIHLVIDVEASLSLQDQIRGVSLSS